MFYCFLCPYVEVSLRGHSSIRVLYTRMLSTSCIRVCNHTLTHVCLCVPVCAAVLLVAQLQDCVEAVGNKCAQASGPKKDISQTGGEAECTGKGRGWSKRGRERSRVGKEMKKRRREMGDGVERGGSIGKEKEKGGQGLLSPGSCYVSHYVSPGHRQHASRQNKRVSLAWHCSYFPILATGSGRGQAAGWGAGGIVGSGLASKTQKAQGSSTS